VIDRPWFQWNLRSLPAPSPTSRLLKSPWFFESKGVLWFHRCHRLHQLHRSLTKTTASLTANELRDSIGDCDSMVGLEFRGVGNRLSSVEPSIAPSTITNIKTTEVPLVLRARVFEGIAGVKDLQEAWPFVELRLL
jgi:hypothetical protein